ncbi:hypothetical protein PFAG_06145, partial [Plasmodium falciparum Santa Lucia]
MVRKQDVKTIINVKQIVIVFKNGLIKKKNEWEKIVEHFNTQDFGTQGENAEYKMLGTGMTADVVLKTVLDLEFANKNTEEDKENNVSAREIDLINEMLEKEKSQEVVGADSKKKNTIDLLIEHEERIAKECKEKNPEKCEDPPTKPPASDVSRSASPATAATATKKASHEDAEEEDDDDDDDEDGGGGDTAEGTEEAEAEEDTEQVDTGPPATKDVVNPCDIVKELFSNTTKFSDACTLKYVTGKNYGWKCIPSGDKTATSDEGAEAKSRHRREADSGEKTTGKSDGSGSICVPPRRRRLYIGRLTQWAEEATKSLSPQGSTSSPSNPRDGLLKAFVESAAVETFFLWDRYKKEKEIEKKEKNRADGQIYASTGEDDENKNKDPQTELNDGTIPIDFLRLMFYTFADYKDILYSGSNDTTSVSKETPSSSNNNNIVVLTSGSTEEKEKMKQLQAKIQEHINSVSTPPPTPGPQNNDEQRKTWWEANGEHIWNAMVCALTYKEDTDSGPDGKTTLKRNDDVYEKIFGKPPNNDNPQNPNNKLTPVTTGTYTTRYQYNTVTLKDESSDAKTNDPINNPKLKDFVKLPPFFRWLHEWGSDFCGTRKRMLEKIKYECRNIERGGHEYCGGDGHYCKTSELKHHKMFADLDCRPCYEQCRKYRKWIDIKFVEFHKQENTYKVEHDKLTNGDNYSGGGDNNCCEQIKKHSSAANFLEALKHCKDGQNNNDQNNIIDFKKPETTFGPLEYCKTCPIYGVKCNSGGRGGRTCTNIDESKYRKGKSINGQNDTNPKEIKVLLLGRKGKDNNNDKKLEEVNNACNNTGLLEDTCVQNWTCQKKSDEVHECNLNGAAESAKYVDSKYFENKISFKILFQSWLIDFIEHYNKSKERITRCTNDANSCKQICNNKCDYVKQWLDVKEGEWEKIKNYYNDNFKDDKETIPSRVKSFLEQGPFEKDYQKAQEVVDNACDKEKLWGCTGPNECKQTDKRMYDDFITNLIDKLKKKATSCQKQHSGDTQPNCVQSSPLPDDEEPEDLLLEENENQVVQPKICPQLPKPQAEEKGDCVPAKTTPKETESTTPKKPAAESEEQIPVPKREEEEAPVPSPKQSPRPKSTNKRRIQPRNVLEHPAVIPALVTSTLAWSVGIGFAAFTYFFLK